MKTIYVREYTWGLSQNVFENLKDAERFDCFPDELVRIIEFVEVSPA